MKHGVTALVLPPEWDFDETLEQVARAGYRCLELVLRDTGYCSLETTPSQLAKLAGRAQAFGIELTGLCPSVTTRSRDMISPDPSVRRDSIGFFRDVIEIAEAVGVPTVLVVPGRVSAEVYYDDAYRFALEGMRELAPIAEARSIDLAIEYVWNDFLLSPLEFAAFCAEVGSPRVGFYFDSGNMVHNGYPEHWVRICAEYLMAVHLKDFRRKGREWSPLLAGDVNFSAVMKEFCAAKYDGALISEVDTGIATLEETRLAMDRIVEMHS